MHEGRSAPTLFVTIMDRRLSRRTLLRGIGLGGASLATAAFVGCGDDDDESTATTAGGPTTTGATTEEAPGESAAVAFAYPFPAPHPVLFFYYASQEMGFWEEEGLDVAIQYQTAAQTLLAGGTVDYAEVSADDILNAWAAGQEVKVFYQSTYGQQFGFVVPEDSPITEWSTEQVRGTTIGITEFQGGEVPITRAALARIGLAEGTDVTLFPTSGDNQAVTVDAFNTGKIDIFSGSILDHASVEVVGLPVRSITPQFILDASGDDAVGTRADYLEKNRDQAVRFGRGMAKGKAWALANFDAAIDIAMEAAPDSGTREEVTAFVKLLRVDRAVPPKEAGIEEGQIWVGGWEKFQTLLLDGSTGSPDDPLTFTEPMDINMMVDNTLVPEINDFDKAEVEGRSR
jgi:ABC-type nitrate/sulfonate/bicarbonate transport system substrate-binding protein